MTDPINLKALRAVAVSATPGRWKKSTKKSLYLYIDAIDAEDGDNIIRTDLKRDQDFIEAFDPPTVRSLLDRIEVLEAAHREIVANTDADEKYNDGSSFADGCQHVSRQFAEISRRALGECE